MTTNNLWEYNRQTMLTRSREFRRDAEKATNIIDCIKLMALSDDAAAQAAHLNAKIIELEKEGPHNVTSSTAHS
jgi:hypothetical protein